MKSISELPDRLKVIDVKVLNNLIQAQKETADIVCEDVKTLAPSKTGQYRESIKVGETIRDINIIETPIYTDAIVETKSGIKYNLGYLLETGTDPHAIPNAFGFGNYYGYIDSNGKYHKGTLDPDWHPGFVSMPHFSLGLENNKLLYRRKIREAIRRSFNG